MDFKAIARLFNTRLRRLGIADSAGNGVVFVDLNLNGHLAEVCSQRDVQKSSLSRPFANQNWIGCNDALLFGRLPGAGQDQNREKKDGGFHFGDVVCCLHRPLVYYFTWHRSELIFLGASFDFSMRARPNVTAQWRAAVT